MFRSYRKFTETVIPVMSITEKAKPAPYCFGHVASQLKNG
jgi:hypothetical protein